MKPSIQQDSSTRRLMNGALLCALFSVGLLVWLIHERPDREPASYQALTEVMSRTMGRESATTEPQMTAASSWAITPEVVTWMVFGVCVAFALAGIILGLMLRRRIGPSATAGSVVALAALVAVIATSFQTGLFGW